MAMKKKFLGLALAAAVALPATGVYADTTIGGNQNDTFTHSVTVTGTVSNKEGIAPEGKIEVELPTAMTFRVDQDGTFEGSDFKVQNRSSVGIDVFVDEFRTNSGNIKVKKKTDLVGQETSFDRSNVYLELSGNDGRQTKTVDLAEVSELQQNENGRKILNVSGRNTGLIQLKGGAGNKDADGSTSSEPQGIDKDGASGDFTLIYKIKKETK